MSLLRLRAVVAATAAGLVATQGACPDARPGGPAPWQGAILEVRAEAGAALDLATLRWAPAGAAHELPGALPGRRLLWLTGSRPGRTLHLRARGACSQQLKLESFRGGSLARVRLRGRFGALGGARVLGAGAEKRLRFLPACPEAALAPLRVEAVDHRTLPLRALPGEHAVIFAMPPLSQIDPTRLPLEPQVLPQARAAQAARTFRLSWAEGDATVAQTLRVVALPRASGFPALALGQQVRIPTEPFVIKRAPSRGETALLPGDPPTFLPSVPGRWTLAAPRGRELYLSARRHDHTRLDCGRAECHPRERAAYATTLMATVGRRGFEGAFGPGFDPRCALACHGTSEPGLPDGGAAHLALELDFALPARGAKGSWDALPRDLRRVAGIGCTACHGPGSLPEHQSTWVILRAGVCATCHDAPPRYAQVAAWRQGRMSRADALPETRAQPCARCHTTGGFLQQLGHLARPVVPEGDVQPGPMGIACAACHSAHRDDLGPSGLRLPPVPAHLRAPEAVPPESRICLPCHASGPELPLPDPPLKGARQAAHPAVADLLYGVKGPGGAPASAHAEVPGGCLGCHRGHAFAVDREICRDCHPRGAPVVRGSQALAYHGAPRVLDLDPDP